MGNLKEITNRIASVQSISKITRAMKMVASSKISRAQSLFNARRPYTKRLMGIMRKALAASGDASHPLMDYDRERRKVGLLIITSEKGLCGSYNSNILKLASKFADEVVEKECEPVYYVLGKKATRFFDRRGVRMEYEADTWKAEDDYAEELFTRIARDYIGGVFDSMYIIYALAKSKSSYLPVRQKILPFSPDDFVLPELAEADDSSGEDESDVIFEPSVDAVIRFMVPMVIMQTIATALVSSRFAEYGARLLAMTNATDNAEKLVEELRLSFFRARQDAITTEILEVSAAAAQIKDKE